MAANRKRTIHEITRSNTDQCWATTKR